MFRSVDKIKELEEELKSALIIKERYKKHADEMGQLLNDPEYISFCKSKEQKIRKEVYGYLADNREKIKVEFDGWRETRSYKDLELTRLVPSMLKEPSYQAIYKKHKLDFAKDLWDFSDWFYTFFNKSEVKEPK